MKRAINIQRLEVISSFVSKIEREKSQSEKQVYVIGKMQTDLKGKTCYTTIRNQYSSLTHFIEMKNVFVVTTKLTNN